MKRQGNAETIEIHFFEDSTDEKTQEPALEVLKQTLTIPSGLSRFALAAMMKGVIENFTDHIDVTGRSEQAKEMLRQVELDLASFKDFVLKAREGTTAEV